MERQVTCMDFMCRVKHQPEGFIGLSPYEQGQNLNERPYNIKKLELLSFGGRFIVGEHLPPT
jgi:hypothetical protein